MKRIIVHGVHRSGTSLTASLLAKAGLWYAEKKYRMLPQEDNSQGFWERTDVVDLNDLMLAKANLSWFTLTPSISQDTLTLLNESFAGQIRQTVKRIDKHKNWFVKDPRFSIMWPLWDQYLEATDHIVVHRHPLSVATSLFRRDGIPLKHGLIFWYHQTRMILTALLDRDNVYHIEFSNDEKTSSQTFKVVNHILSNKLIEPLVQADFDSIFSRELVHCSKINGADLDAHPVIKDAWNLIVDREFEKLLQLPEIVLSEMSWGELDSVYALNNIFVKSNREKLQFEDELSRIHHTNSDLILENQKLGKTVGLLNEDIRVLNERLLEIAVGLRAFMLTKRYLMVCFIGKLITRLGFARLWSLHDIFDKSKFGHSASELERVLPKPSNRYLLLKAFAKNPMAFTRRVNFTRIYKGLLTIFGKGEMDIGVKQALLQYSSTDLPVSSTLDILDPEYSEEWLKTPLVFKPNKKPKVSIVIPVYNNYLTTLACLYSIEKHIANEGLSYEIIIADDCSSDETKTIANSIAGLRVIRNKSNLGFLKNCNNAISKAKGEFIALLNNDTNVQDGWLSELLAPLENDSSIGITGPMFIYPDGRLQEAGGIIFKDASGWNYGRFDQPDKPEYNYSRDVDYISGACLIFRSSLWNEIGGFDEQFAPAYYEDTDFCFEVRKLGKRIHFVPTAKVVHFEGVSHGNNEDTGIKKYQALNRTKFESKWRKILDSDHFEGPADLFKARIHGRSKKVLLFIDHHVPFWDKDAGSKVALRYIMLLMERGVHVIFLGDNFYPHQPYTTKLQKLGVEVLYGEDYKTGWFDWLQANSQNINSIYLNRPHISEVYIDKILSLDHIPYLAYHGADLHYLRVGREEKLGISSHDGRSAADWKETELALMRKCNVSLWLSEREVKLVAEEDPSIHVAYKPMYWFEESDLAVTRKIVSDKNILFVGGFGHPPNKDGLEWFLGEIYPIVLEQCPNTKLTIIGSNCPESIQKLTSENIEVLGYVSDEHLIEAYANARVSIVPLRYGAGVKGKVIESMQYGVTVLTTSIGVEGLPAEPSTYLSVAKNENLFAKQLIELLENDEMCLEKVQLADQVLLKYFSRNSAIEAVNLILGS